MARTDYAETNTYTFSNVADTLTNEIFIHKIIVDGATAAGSVIMWTTANGLIWRWTFGASGSEESKETVINQRVTGIKFTSLTGLVIVKGDVVGTPAP